jgi:gamma-glutamyl:cysteine ligase YbdK (ATP-grasp superfamily)
MGLLPENDSLWSWETLSKAVLLAVMVVAIVAWSRASERAFKRRVQAAEPDERRWQIAKNRWNGLYYCARNDCVFDPTTNESAPTDQLHDLLFRHT